MVRFGCELSGPEADDNLHGLDTGGGRSLTMERFGWLLLAFALAYGCALAVPLLGWWSRGRLLIWGAWCFAVGALACPLLIPADSVMLRAASAVVSTDLVFKMVDFLRHHRHPWDGRVVREYGRFLIPFPVFSIVYPDHKRRLARPDPSWPHMLRILGGTIGLAAGIGLARMVAANAVVRVSPVLDHALRVLIFVPTIESISRVLYGLERLTGFETTPIVRNAFLSRTVAEFWRRYNGRMHDWYRRNVFRPSDGRHAPARATFFVFLVSGLHHELMFGIATSRFTGYQLAFFLAQAPAVLASGRLERFARRGGLAGKVAAHGVTIVFLSATSVLFFHGVSEVFPAILANGSPLP